MRNNIKKIFILCISLLLVFSVCAGCGAKEQVENAADQIKDAVTEGTEYIKDQVQNVVEEYITDSSESSSSTEISDTADNNDVNADRSESADDVSDPASESADSSYVTYKFRNEKLLNQHYEKHGIAMGFDSAELYEEAASDVINNPNALTKTEAEDGDYIYYLEESNEFVVLSTDGFIRTYFNPDDGKAYYDRQ